VTYTGGGDAVLSTLGGHVDVTTENMSEMLPLVEGGKMRILAISLPKRSPDLADVPTFREQGFDTPDEVIRRAREVLKLLEAEQLAGSGKRRERGSATQPPMPAEQLALFGAPQPHPVVDRLKRVDPNATTPLQALTLLAQLVEEANRSAS
jgi:hypothetical protein